MFEHVLTQSRAFIWKNQAYRKMPPGSIREGIERVQILMKGSAFFDWNGERRIFRRGTIFWHVSGETPIWESPPDDPYHCFSITFEVTRPARPVQRVSIWRDLETLAPFCSEVIQTFVSRPEERPLLAHYCYAFLLLHSIPFTHSAEECNPYLVRVLRYMKEHCCGPVTVEELLGQMKLSRTYLFRFFREELHSTPHQYLLKLRLDKAKELLVSEDISVKEIADRCGFASAEVFFRQFRKNTQLTPVEYRRSYTAAENSMQK